MTNNPNIRIAKSLVDYIFRWMGMKFLDRDAQRQIGYNGITIDETKIEEIMVVKVDGIKEKAVSVTPPTAVNQDVSLDVEKVAMPAGKKFMFDTVSDAQSCSECGGMMTRNGSCYVCRDCGATSGCS